MNLRDLLGNNIDPTFLAGAEWRRGYDDYPSFDTEYRYSEQYQKGYCAAFEDDQDAKDQRWLEEREFPALSAVDRRRGL